MWECVLLTWQTEFDSEKNEIRQPWFPHLVLRKEEGIEGNYYLLISSQGLLVHLVISLFLLIISWLCWKSDEDDIGFYHELEEIVQVYIAGFYKHSVYRLVGRIF